MRVDNRHNTGLASMHIIASSTTNTPFAPPQHQRFGGGVNKARQRFVEVRACLGTIPLDAR